MKVVDYIVDTLIREGVTDVFGYPGGSVTNLMEAFRGREKEIKAHSSYHEQGAAFAACGYALVSGKIGVAYATAGPGATNLLTGLCDAWFDSIPVIFFTGQVNTFETRGNMNIRQRGFQETDIVPMVHSVTKYAVQIKSADELPQELHKALYLARSGRPGPVLLDLPMNVQRMDIPEDVIEATEAPVMDEKGDSGIEEMAQQKVQALLARATRPCLLLGAGVKLAGCSEALCKEAERLGVPIVTSMIAVDAAAGSEQAFGFVGAYGERPANFIVAKSDLVIAIGSRMSIRQVGFKRENFAPKAQLVRFDIDPGELAYTVHGDEHDFCLDARTVVEILQSCKTCQRQAWLAVCHAIANKLCHMDDTPGNQWAEMLGKYMTGAGVVTTDVGQNQVWVAQSFPIDKQQVLFSGGHGAMGFSLPAAIGACYAHPGKVVVCFAGDGGLQMNIQELQMVVRERLPIKIMVFNNHALGMIRHFQEMYFDRHYYQTKAEGGYTVPDFARVAEAYGIRSRTLNSVDEIATYQEELHDSTPVLWQINLPDDTYIKPKLRFGSPNQDQEPLLDRRLYEEIMAM